MYRISHLFRGVTAYKLSTYRVLSPEDELRAAKRARVAAARSPVYAQMLDIALEVHARINRDCEYDRPYALKNRELNNLFAKALSDHPADMLLTGYLRACQDIEQLRKEHETAVQNLELRFEERVRALEEAAQASTKPTIDNSRKHNLRPR